MESLRKVASGDHDVAIGISGFGSARVSHDRWLELARLTGRSTYYLQYDAQELPWPAGGDMVWTPDIYREGLRRWNQARSGARVAADFLVVWLERMTRADKKVLIVGFSLGAFVAWSAVRQLPDDLKSRIELVFLSAAIGDRVETWQGIEHVHRVVNIFSSDDLALKYIYPRGVGTDETPAAGLGPLLVSDLPAVENVDLTDMIGRDHLWGSYNIIRLVRIALGCLWGFGDCGVVCSESSSEEASSHLSPEVVERLYRWTFIDPGLWQTLADALNGSAPAVRFMLQVDRWTLEADRLSYLLNAGVTVSSLASAKMQPMTAVRSQQVLRGLIRRWLSESRDLAAHLVR